MQNVESTEMVSKFFLDEIQRDRQKIYLEVMKKMIDDITLTSETKEIKHVTKFEKSHVVFFIKMSLLTRS